MPNPLRNLAKGEELIVVWVPIWTDDVSANITKQWNEHMNIYMSNGNIPGQLLQQEFFVHFISTSGHASCSEQLSSVMEKIQ